ncbi:hypothetical protein LOD99_6731 [Oopsacas minuta]|uniref:Uncharacterized protein n=1 Tax=Oopsacas minuta TaxID=111878 RepID=A0AAV7JME9_9METZ|nr:hypothetical protein LOD99_6731 [Oopsacas minuta]
MALNGETTKPLLDTSTLFQKDVDHFFSVIKFAKWDNLCGPKVLKVWRSEISTELVHDSDSLIYISNHILNGEVWRLTTEESIELKFYIFPKFNLITLSAIFLQMSDVYSLSFLFPLSQLSLYTPLHSTFCDIIRDRFAINPIGNRVTGMYQLLLHIMPEFIRIRYHYVPLSMEDTLLNRKLSSDKFLHRCCGSHLLTGGRTVVCGKNTRHVRSMLHTLSYFMLDEDRPLTHLFSGEHLDYHSYYYLQAFSNIDTCKEQIVRHSKERVTLIDLDSNYVYVFQAGRIGKNNKAPEAFIKVRKRAILIKDFFLELDFLPNIVAIRELYIRDFIRVLMKKAFALLSFEGYLREFESPGDHDPGLLFSQLKQDLLLERDEDLGIVLSFAHRISPVRTNKMLRDFIMISASQVEIKSIL